jgi:5-methylcytosine-specific restriction endonuclease McrA
MRVFVLDKNKRPLDPCHPARARKLLDAGRAAVFKRFPFTIILMDRTIAESVVHPHRIKIDPGSKITGVTIVREGSGHVVAAVEIEHRGQAVKDAMDSRRVLRRFRRSRKTRYRQPRFDNRTRPEGWLSPSLESRVTNVMTWVARLRRSCPVMAISMELVRFDFQQMENPEIAGVEYQQGTLFGYEVREYLLEKWKRKCAYCGKTDVPLQVEHTTPKSRGGTDRVSNLALACEPCNRRKSNRPIEEFLKGKPDVLARILRQACAPLKDAAAVNVTRWELFRRLKATGLPVECGSGGRTKFNRTTRGLPKTHWIDAACVGASTPERLKVDGVRPLMVKATGHGSRQMCGTDKYGFPIRHRPCGSGFAGFKTGDIVQAVIPNGKYAGTHVGRVAIRYRPKFRLGSIDVHPRHLRTIHRSDGYDYDQADPFIEWPDRITGWDNGGVQGG